MTAGPPSDLLAELLGPGRPAAGGLAVRGGAGGVVVEGGELLEASELLRRTADGVVAAVVDAAGLVGRGTGDGGALDPVGAARVAAALAGATGGAVPTTAACALLAARLAAAGAAYAEAEGAVVRAVGAARGAVGSAVGRAAGAGLAAVADEGLVVLAAATAAGGLVWLAVRALPAAAAVGDATVVALADGRLDTGERAALASVATGLPTTVRGLAAADAAAVGGSLAAEVGAPLGVLGDGLSRAAADHPVLLQHVVGAAPAAVAAGTAGLPLGRLLDAGSRAGAAAGGLPGGDRLVWPPRTVADLSAGVSVVATQDGALRPTAVALRPHGPPAAVAPARGTADLLGRAAPMAGGGSLSPGGRGRSAAPLAVERVVDADGARRWVLVLPPTQTTAAPWSSSTTNPADLGTDLRAVGQVPHAASRAAVAALEAAGVPPDEPVLLVGYSQGGIVAAQLAADPAVRERFAVDAVLTAGSPVGGFDLPPSVAVLQVEHEADWIRSLDGADNPTGPGRTTVLRDVPAAEVLAGGGDLRDGMAAHDLDLYRRTADLADASADPSLVAWRERVAPYLAAEGRTSTVQVYAAERVPGRP